MANLAWCACGRWYVVDTPKRPGCAWCRVAAFELRMYLEKGETRG